METMTTASETDGIPPPPLQKVILVGESGVGKSSLVTRYQNGQFRQGHLHPTVAVAHSYVDEEIHSSTKVRYTLWDTGGTERFRCMFPQYFREAHVAVIAYDVTRQSSFEAVETVWRRELLRHVPFAHVILVGTKTDLLDARMVSTKGQALAERCGCKFLETSAASGENVDVLFHDIATILARLQQSFHLELSLKTAAIRVRHPPPEKTHKRRCCVLS